MVCLPLIAEQNAHEICLTQECLQIERRLLWKQTTTHSIRNNNPMFDQQPLPRFNCTSQYILKEIVLEKDVSNQSVLFVETLTDVHLKADSTTLHSNSPARCRECQQ